MYLDSKEDYQTVWQLAHNWVDADSGRSDPTALSNDLKEAIHRLMSASINKNISVRTRRIKIFTDESFLSVVFDIPHLRRFWKCLRNNEFDKAYLDSLYLKRGDVLRWCQNEFLSPPRIWKTKENIHSNDGEVDDENNQWHERLTDRQKSIVTCLEIAKRLWKENPALFYEEVYNHPDMIRQDKPRVFTLKSFKRWSKEFASEAAKAKGRRKESRE